MTEDVRWPKASEGGAVVGKDEIRAYWTRQWGEFDPRVEPLAMSEEEGGKVRVRVRQVVKSLAGGGACGRRGAACVYGAGWVDCGDGAWGGGWDCWSF